MKDVKKKNVFVQTNCLLQNKYKFVNNNYNQ